jgi:xylulokinase
MKTDVFNKIASVLRGADRYLAVALQSTAGASLAFLRDRILYHRDELLDGAPRSDACEAFNKIAARVPAGANGLIYMPWLFGERTPVDDPHLRAGLINLSLAHTREDVVRAFLEGVALNTRWMMEPFGRFLGQPSGEIIAAGGGAQSDLWCQIIADVTNRPVRQLVKPMQANAIGAAFIAAAGLGALQFSDLPALQRVRCVYEPDAALRELYDERFDVFKDLYRRLAPVYRRLNAPAVRAAREWLPAMLRKEA